MIKLIHTADLHLGIGLSDLYETPQIVQQRFNDFVENLKSIKDFAISSNADFLILAGDIFHHPRPSSQAFNAFSQIIGEILKEEIPIIAVLGNHDTTKTSEMLSYLRGFVNVNLKNFYLFDVASKILLRAKNSNEKVKFIGIPYPHFQSTLSYSDYVFKVENKINELLQNDEADYNVIVGHIYVEGGKIGSEQRIASLRDYPLPKSVFERENVHITCLGHLHTPQKVGNKIFYSGSIERIDFGEEGEEKSFLEIVLGDKIHVTNVKLKLRPMKTIYIKKEELVNNLNINATLQNILEKYNVEEGSLLRIRIKGSDIIRNISMNQIEKYLYDKKKVLAFKLEEIKEEESLEEININTKWNFKEALDEYLKLRYRNENPEVINKVKFYVEKIMEEVKLNEN